MKKWLLRLVYTCAVLMPIAAVADYQATQGSGSIIFAFTCFSTKICPAHTLVNSAGTEIATSGNPMRTDPTGTTTQPVSASSLPLPTGAATSAKQPALGTAGSPSSDVITVQGNASGTPIPVTNSNPPTLGSSSGGWTYKRLSALSTTVQAIKSSAAGQLGMLHCANSAASGSSFIQVFDVATAGAVTLGTTPPNLSFEITAGSSSGFALPLVGVQFSAGIQIAATSTATGSSAPGTVPNCNVAFN